MKGSFVGQCAYAREYFEFLVVPHMYVEMLALKPTPNSSRGYRHKLKETEQIRTKCRSEDLSCYISSTCCDGFVSTLLERRVHSCTELARWLVERAEFLPNGSRK